MRPRVVQITAAAVLPGRDLFARIASISSLPEPARRAFAVQLRDPELSGRALLDLGARLRAATRAASAGLVVNDRADLALLLGADGVHLGRRSIAIADARALLGPDAWISVACHAVADAVRAASEGASAVLLSPIFPSPGKGAPLGLAALRAARAALPAGVDLLALGGVDPSNAAACFAAGADAVASIRADLTGFLDASS